MDNESNVNMLVKKINRVQDRINNLNYEKHRLEEIIYIKSKYLEGPFMYKLNQLRDSKNKSEELATQEYERLILIRELRKLEGRLPLIDEEIHGLQNFILGLTRRIRFIDDNYTMFNEY